MIYGFWKTDYGIVSTRQMKNGLYDPYMTVVYENEILDILTKLHTKK